MAAFSIGEDEDWSSKLLLETSESLMQMAHIARINDTDEEAKISYSHLISDCIKLRDFSLRARQSLSRRSRDTVNQALAHLGSIVSESCLQQLPSYFATLEFRLGMLNLHWAEVRRQHIETKLEFISRWLILGEQYVEVDKALETCADELDKQHYDEAFKKPSEKLASLDIGEPSYVVCKAAQSIFDALLSCKRCSCPNQHDFGAKLKLGTYRRPSKGKLDESVRGRVRKARTNGDATGEFDFDIFLSMERNWHEVRVRIVDEHGVCLNRPPASIKGDRHARVERLCGPITKTKARDLQRIVLKLTNGQLFEMGFQKSLIDKSASPISLSQCFEERHEFFTEKTKRILSLIIASTILHLNGTSWLQPGLMSNSIKFFQTTLKKIPLRPFIQTQLPQGHPSSAIDLRDTRNDGDCDDEASDDLDFGHRCPAMVSLAVVLLEIYFVKPFKELAKMYNVQLVKLPSRRFTLIDVDQVLNGDEEVNKEGCRSQIPEDSPFLMAIDNCLDGELWEDEEGEALGVETGRSRIYQHVVRPLELHLTHGFSQIPLDGVDEYAKDLDFGRWGQTIASREQDSQETSLLSEALTTPRAPSPAIVQLNTSQDGSQPSESRSARPFSQLYPSYLSSNLDTMPIINPSYGPSQFFGSATGDRISLRPPASRTHFRIAIICASPREADAAILLFDKFWDEEGDYYGRADGDMNAYITGRIGDHNVVLAILPSMGNNGAAAATASLRSSYTNLKLAILVGTCGGVPRIANHDAFLGDVVVSKTIIQYDYGWQYPGRFTEINTIEDRLGRANKDIRGLLAIFETELMRVRLQKEASKHLKHLQETAIKERRRADYSYPGMAEDILYSPVYAHKHRTSCDLCNSPGGCCNSVHKTTCAEVGCGSANIVRRKHTVEEANFNPEIFIGRVGSGNKVIKSANERDRMASNHNIIAFETEGAGAWDEVPSIVVKGICDYADGHKNEAWQDFAAATAAAVMKAILTRYIVHNLS
ncbi:hypothetical protein V8C35DRAFT_232070 [Trichoderma chlorosporum]